MESKPHVYFRLFVYVVLCACASAVCAQLVNWLGGYFLALTFASLVAAVAANWLTLRIYGPPRFASLGLSWNRASARNLALGVAGGMGAAALALLPALAAHLARFAPAPEARTSWDIFLFTSAALLAGAAGEEILFHGYGFQALLAEWGPYTTVFTVGALFGLLHGGNPHSTWLGVANTAGFGVLFGWAFLRSRDLWLPIGLHFGWNFALPLFGVNVSGLTMKLTDYQMQWNVGSVWSGGEYGPEGSVLATLVLPALALFLWKAPIRTQSPEGFPCVPGSVSSSS